MNYLILKSIIEATLSHFRCKNCGGGASDADVNLVSINGNALHFEVNCSACHTQGVVRAEIGVSALGNNLAGKNINPTELLNKIQQQVNNGEIKTTINDTDIVSLRENLKDIQSLQDLFNAEQ